MKAIHITDANANAINDAIASIEGRATARLMGYDDILSLIKQLEQTPAVSILPKKYRKGVKANLQIGHKLAARYFGRSGAEATRVTVMWLTKGWCLVDATRTFNHDSNNDLVEVILPEIVADKAVELFKKTFH